MKRTLKLVLLDAGLSQVQWLYTGDRLDALIDKLSVPVITVACSRCTALQDAEAEGSLVPQRVLQDERRRRQQLQAENLRLKAVITTVRSLPGSHPSQSPRTGQPFKHCFWHQIQETNKQWQGFNADRQAYIRRLLSTIEEQQTQLNACLDALKTSAPPPDEPDPASVPASALVFGRAPPHVDAESRLRHLQREVSDLQRRLEEAKREHKDTVTLLQCQVNESFKMYH